MMFDLNVVMCLFFNFENSFFNIKNWIFEYDFRIIEWECNINYLKLGIKRIKYSYCGRYYIYKNLVVNLCIFEWVLWFVILLNNIISFVYF